MRANKLYTLLIALLCTTSLSAQYKLDVMYSIHDRELISYESIVIPQDANGNYITPSTPLGTLTIPITINFDGSVMLPKRTDNLKIFRDVIESQVSTFRFSEGYSAGDVLTVNYSPYSKNPLERLEFPATLDVDNLISVVYLTLFGNTPISPEKQAITLNTTKTLLKAAKAKLKTYNEPNVWPYGKNNKQDIYDFINNGALFPFEYLLNKDSQELLDELVASNSNPETSQSIKLLDEIQRLLFHVYNSRVLKLALQDIDKSGYDWQAAVSNKVWGDNPKSLIIPKHRQSWTSLMEFITETLPSNPEAVVVDEVLKYFTAPYGGNEYKTYGDFRQWDWPRWVKMSLDNDFEKEFIEKIEKYKIVGYPNDSKEEVSEIFGCAMLRANLIAYKNSQTIFDPYISQFMEGENKFEITVRQESKATYANNDVNMVNMVFFKDFLTALSRDKKVMKLLDKKRDSEIEIGFIITRDNSVTNIKINTPTTLTPKEATMVSEAITEALQSLSQWIPAYRDHKPALDWVSFNLSGNSILESLRSPSNSETEREFFYR